MKPESYNQVTEIEPFSNQKLTQALKRKTPESVTNAALIAPELARRKEPLEAFALDSMVMVGSLTKAGQPTALIKVENLLYQVKIGNYLGLNYGRVMNISEARSHCVRLHKDAVGEWIERAATLQLQEREVEMKKVLLALFLPYLQHWPRMRKMP